MEVVISLLQIVLPGTLVLIGVYLVVRDFLQKEFEKKALEVRGQNVTIVLPVRLQAYERVALLLERLAPHNLIRRVNNPAYNVGQFQQMLLQEVREEMNHNLSQQIYMTDQAWTLVKNAIEEISSLINQSTQGLSAEAPGIELARAIFERLIQANQDPTDRALRFLKEEIQAVF